MYIKKDGKLPHPCIFTQFAQPLFYHGDFPLHVSVHKISLEFCIYGSGTEFTAFVRVTDSLSVRSVFARYTVDDWRSSIDVDADLVQKHYKEEDSDRYVCDMAYFNPGTTEFALCVKTTEGRELWDNNSGRNYKVGLTYQ